MILENSSTMGIHTYLFSLFSFVRSYSTFLSVCSYFTLLRLSLVLHCRLPSLSLSREYTYILVDVTQCFALSFYIHFTKKKVSFVFYLTTFHRSSKAVGYILNYLFFLFPLSKVIDIPPLFFLSPL